MLAMPFTFAHRDTVDSPYATQLMEGFRRLCFVPTLEHEFREAYAETNLGRVRLSLILALALLAGVTGVDWWTLPEPLRPWSVAVRIGAVCPFEGPVGGRGCDREDEGETQRNHPAARASQHRSGSLA